MVRYLLLALLLLPLTSAYEFNAQPGEQATIYAACIENGAYINSTANIFIYTLSQSLYSSGNMTTYALGQHRYSFTAPATPGQYPFTVNCTKLSTGSTRQQSDNFQVTDGEATTGMAQLAITLIFISVLVYLIYQAKHLEFTADEMGAQVQKIVNKFVLMSTSWFIPIILGVANAFAQGTNIQTFTANMFLLSLVLVGIFTVYMFVLVTIDYGILRGLRAFNRGT